MYMAVNFSVVTFEIVWKSSYLPHRATIRNDKIRVVYDASAKTKSNHSLNDLMHAGPSLTEDLVKLLLNFRNHALLPIIAISK